MYTRDQPRQSRQEAAFTSSRSATPRFPRRSTEQPSRGRREAHAQTRTRIRTACSRRVEDAVRHATLLVNRPRFHAARDNDEVEWQGGRVYLHLGAR
jgi:hypothetical protein